MHDFLTIWPTSGYHGRGQKIFAHDYGQNVKDFVVKWSELLTMTIVKIQISRGHNGQPAI